VNCTATEPDPSVSNEQSEEENVQPEVMSPEVIVLLVHPSKAVEVVADSIVKPIEAELTTIKYVDEISSGAWSDSTKFSVTFDISMMHNNAVKIVENEVKKAMFSTDFIQSCSPEMVYVIAN
jgi:multidrug efflux pump subunit AcrB